MALAVSFTSRKKEEADVPVGLAVGWRDDIRRQLKECDGPFRIPQGQENPRPGSSTPMLPGAAIPEYTRQGLSGLGGSRGHPEL